MKRKHPKHWPTCHRLWQDNYCLRHGTWQIANAYTRRRRSGASRSSAAISLLLYMVRIAGRSSSSAAHRQKFTLQLLSRNTQFPSLMFHTFVLQYQCGNGTKHGKYPPDKFIGFGWIEIQVDRGAKNQDHDYAIKQ